MIWGCIDTHRSMHFISKSELTDRSRCLRSPCTRDILNQSMCTERCPWPFDLEVRWLCCDVGCPQPLPCSSIMSASEGREEYIQYIEYRFVSKTELSLSQNEMISFIRVGTLRFLWTYLWRANEMLGKKLLVLDRLSVDHIFIVSLILRW